MFIKYCWAGLLLGCQVLFLGNSNIWAQNIDYSDKHRIYDLSYRTFRAALVPGLSTNGINATRYASKYSLNILGGYNGALDGRFELGGLVNVNKFYAHGTQIAGLANISGAETAGFQLAGLLNYASEDLLGVQVAGLGNISPGDVQGLQFTGGINWSGGSAQGVQVAGLGTFGKSDVSGLFFSGAGNVTPGSLQGISVSGIVNFAGQDMQGIVASGLLNYSRDFTGIAAATVNLNPVAQGIQIGALNLTSEMEGVQVGLINYSKEMSGLPVGLISYYGNGRKNVDVWTSDGGFVNTGFKLGTEDVYNTISIGYNPSLNRDVWQLGWSIGLLREFKTHSQYNDFSIYKINEGGWTKDLNYLYKYRILFGKEFTDNLYLYGGPTVNMLISRVDGSSDYTWYRLFDFGAKGRDYVFWIGYSLGVELF